MSRMLRLLILLLITGCQNTSQSLQKSQYDFDHGVYFEKQQLTDSRYHILVRADQKVRFERLAAFLMREALTLCKGYGFQLEVLNGVEDFDDRRARPNYIQSSLRANIECPVTTS